MISNTLSNLEMLKYENKLYIYSNLEQFNNLCIHRAYFSGFF